MRDEHGHVSLRRTNSACSSGQGDTQADEPSPECGRRRRWHSEVRGKGGRRMGERAPRQRPVTFFASALLSGAVGGKRKLSRSVTIGYNRLWYKIGWVVSCNVLLPCGVVSCHPRPPFPRTGRPFIFHFFFRLTSSTRQGAAPRPCVCGVRRTRNPA